MIAFHCACESTHSQPHEVCLAGHLSFHRPPADSLYCFSQVAEIFNPGRMTVCLTSATSGSAHMGMVPPKGYLAMGSSMQKLPGGAMAVLHSLQLPNLTSVLQDEPDMAGCATSEVRPF